MTFFFASSYWLDTEALNLRLPIRVVEDIMEGQYVVSLGPGIDLAS